MPIIQTPQHTFINITAPEDLKDFLQSIKTSLPKLLGNTLFGVYIYGSLSCKSFEEHTSDVDIIVVINRKLNDSEFEKLKIFYDSKKIKKSRWVDRLEMDYVVHAVLNDLNSVVKFKHGIKTTHFAHGKLHRKANSDGGNPINWLNIKQCGIPLFGPLPKKFAPEINTDLVIAAMRRGLKEIKSDLRDIPKKDLRHQVFTAATLCRIAYVLEKGKMVSKKTALRWAGNNFPLETRLIAKVASLRFDDCVERSDQILVDGLPVLANYVGTLFLHK